MLRAEPLDQHGFKIAERDPAIDRAAGGERDQQRIGAADRSGGGLGRAFDPCQPGFERGNAAIVGRHGHRRRDRRGGQWLADDLDRRARDHAKEACPGVPPRQAPRRQRRASHQQQQGPGEARGPGHPRSCVVDGHSGDEF